MIVLGFYLVMVGIADATRGLPRVATRWANLRGLTLALAVGVLGVEYGAVPPLIMAVLFVFTVAWVLSTPGGRAGTRWPLLAFAVSIVGVLLMPAPNTTSQLDLWMQSFSQAPAILQSPGSLVLLLGCGLFLLETSNILVRLVLASETPRTGLSEDASELKGGRIIGPLERLLVFGLAAAGQFAAIGAVLAAKGVVRFPELSRSASKRKAGDAPSRDAEYFLIGSLASWGLALLVSLLIAR